MLGVGLEAEYLPRQGTTDCPVTDRRLAEDRQPQGGACAPVSSSCSVGGDERLLGKDRWILAPPCSGHPRHLRCCPPAAGESTQPLAPGSCCLCPEEPVETQPFCPWGPKRGEGTFCRAGHRSKAADAAPAGAEPSPPAHTAGRAQAPCGCAAPGAAQRSWCRRCPRPPAGRTRACSWPRLGGERP